MSQKYTCRIALKETVTSDDEITQKLTLENILTPEDMKALLRTQLETDGWVKGEDDIYQKTDDQGIVSRVNPETGDVSHKLEAKAEINEEVSGTADTWNLDDSKKQAKEIADRRALEIKKKREDKLAGEVRKKLSDAESAKTEEVALVLRGVYAEALKQKARKMGEVVSQNEGTNQNGEYELVIKVVL